MVGDGLSEHAGPEKPFMHEHMPVAVEHFPCPGPPQSDVSVGSQGSKFQLHCEKFCTKVFIPPKGGDDHESEDPRSTFCVPLTVVDAPDGEDDCWNPSSKRGVF